MKIAIIDDELHCIKSLLIHMNSLFPDNELVYKTTKPKEAFGPLNELDIDLLFLDVEMPGINGFELLEQFEKLPFHVIFTTAYSQYALQAFKAQAINYLLKPIDELELKEAVINWKEKYHQKEESKEVNDLLKYLKKEGLLDSKIAVPISGGFEFLDVKKILYCQSSNNYTSIFMECGERLVISKTLKMVENGLERFYFLRTHQSYLINPNFMKQFVRSDGGYLVMSDGKRIPVSPSKRELITGIFEALNRENPIE